MKRLLITFFVHALTCFGIFGQSVSQITGTVRDAGGLVVPGAEITVTQTDTGQVRTAVTSVEGAYVLPSLPIGPCRMVVRKEGFSTYVHSGIVLQVDTVPTIDPVLKIGTVSEHVRVEAAAAMVESSRHR